MFRLFGGYVTLSHSQIPDASVRLLAVYTLVFLAGIGETATEGYINWVYTITGWGNPLAEIDYIEPLFVQVDLQPVFVATCLSFSARNFLEGCT